MALVAFPTLISRSSGVKPSLFKQSCGRRRLCDDDRRYVLELTDDGDGDDGDSDSDWDEEPVKQ